MFDLPYIATHPLLAQIIRRCAELEEHAAQLAQGSEERKRFERRISILQEYKLPKPDEIDRRQSEPVVNQWGQLIGERHSLRRRLKETRRGRPAEYRLKTRAALEDKLADRTLTWSQLAQRYEFQNVEVLKRAIRRLKTVLRREGIPLPAQAAYQEAKEAFDSFFRTWGEE